MKRKKLNTQSNKFRKTKKKAAIAVADDEYIDEEDHDEIEADLEEELDEVQEEVVVEEVVEVVKKIKPRDREHYVNGKEFEEEIRQFYNTGNISIKLGESITKIANGLSFAPNFINYSYKDDMVGDAIVKMFSALKNKKFKLDSGFSPFSYFTTIAFHAFINRIKKEKKHHEALTEYREKVYMEMMLDPNETHGAHIYVDPNSGHDDE
jgi:DNA-directed RNA polymerase specialized sigma24 family protein